MYNDLFTILYLLSTLIGMTSCFMIFQYAEEKCEVYANNIELYKLYNKMRISSFSLGILLGLSIIILKAIGFIPTITM